MTATRRRIAPVREVELQAHALDRWTIHHRRMKVPAEDVPHARLLIVEAAHREAGVPPIRSLIRRSLPYARAV
jgi:hypothetical protein